MSKKPTGFEIAFQILQKMRAPGGSCHPAPVDTMGCQQWGDNESNARVARFRTLTGIALSASVSDKQLQPVMRELIDQHNLNLDWALEQEASWQTRCRARLAAGAASSPSSKAGREKRVRDIEMAEVVDTVVYSVIQPLGLGQQKARNFLNMSRMLQDQFEGDVPKTLNQLKMLPGVGQKVGQLALQHAWGINDGVAVDVHVHRIADRIGWTTGAKKPEDTAAQLEQWLEPERFAPINHLLVGLGQTMCNKAAPRCSECALAPHCRLGSKKRDIEDLPAAFRSKRSKKR